MSRGGQVRPLTDIQRAVAESELGENPKRRAKDLQHIRDWLAKQPHITARTDDQWLLTFLRGCKFSLERTKHKLDTYYSVRSAVPELFAGRSPFEPKVQAILDSAFITYLPQTDAQGRRVTVLRLGRVDASAVSGDDIFRLNFMSGDLSLYEDDAAVICGAVAIVDLHGVSLSHAGLFPPAAIKKAMTIFQDAYPFRVKSIHFVNTPGFYEAVIGLFLSFMKEKLRKRVIIHSTMDSLQKHFSKDMLPAEYGGNAGPIDELTAEWRRRLEQQADWFKAEDRFKTDESLRPGQPRNRSALFGVEGSFRQLDVD